MTLLPPRQPVPSRASGSAFLGGALRLGDTAQTGVWEAHAPLQSQNLLNLMFWNRLQGLADLLGDEEGLAVVFKDLHQPLGVGDGVGPADNAVVGEQDGIVPLDKGPHGLGKSL